jgi:hypothetical protein
LVAGCSKELKVSRTDPNSSTEGIRYSIGVPFLIIKADGTSEVKMLPDPSQTYVVQPATSMWGSSEINVKLVDGQLQELSSKSDKKIAETLQGAASLTMAIGSMLKDIKPGSMAPGLYKIDVVNSKLIPVVPDGTTVKASHEGQPWPSK